MISLKDLFSVIKISETIQTEKKKKKKKKNLYPFIDQRLHRIGDICIPKPYAHEFDRRLGINRQTCSVQFCIDQELPFFV